MLFSIFLIFISGWAQMRIENADNIRNSFILHFSALSITIIHTILHCLHDKRKVFRFFKKAKATVARKGLN